MPSLILSERGTPEPPTEVQRRLAQIDDRLFLAWYPFGPHGQGVWAIRERWAETDPRRQFIQRGEMRADADFDQLGTAPVGCSADDAFAFVVQALRQRAATKGEADRMLSRVDQYNAAQAARNVAPVKARAAELIDANAPRIAGDLAGDSPTSARVAMRNPVTKDKDRKRLREFVTDAKPGE